MPDRRPPVLILDDREPHDILRRAFPWLAASTFIAIMLAASTVIVLSRPEQLTIAQPVEVSFGDNLLGAQGNDADGGELPAAAPGELPIPRSLPAARPFHAVGSLDSMSRLKPIGPKVVAPGAGTAQPSAEEVLSDLPASTASNAQPEEKFGWAGGSQRNLVSAREPHFPAILGASGVEVECTAQITVSPAGNVTRVEITKGSGYTEVDASVEAALREFLFSQVDGSRDAVGTVTFRFRLEKQD